MKILDIQSAQNSPSSFDLKLDPKCLFINYKSAKQAKSILQVFEHKIELLCMIA